MFEYSHYIRSVIRIREGRKTGKKMEKHNNREKKSWIVIGRDRYWRNRET